LDTPKILKYFFDYAFIHLGFKPQAIGSNLLKQVMGVFLSFDLTRLNEFSLIAWGLNPRRGIGCTQNLEALL
jgi:hypothetical protein